MSMDKKYIVIIGETGSGKSTFINYLANYFKRGKVDNPKIAIPTRFHNANMGFAHEEQSVNDVTTSKTVDCQDYRFELEGIDFHFIDTPGINATGGQMQNNRNVEKIFRYIEQLHEITALILIINGTVSRATVNICQVLSTFQQYVPDVVYNNMLIVLTNCQTHTVSFHPEDFGLPSGCPVFHMQNSAFSSDFHQWSEKTQKIIEKDFQKSMDTINQLILKFIKLEPQSTEKFKDMDDDRNSIKRKLHDARMMLMNLQHLEDELVAYEFLVNSHTMNIEKFRKSLESKNVMQLERILTDYYSTICSICNTICQEKCKLNEVRFSGDKISLRCDVMNNGSCKKCGCNAISHYHDRSIVRSVNRTIQESVSSLEQRYREAKADKEKANIKYNNIREKKTIIESELKSQYSKVKESLKQIRRTCSGVNVSAELYDCINCLKKDVNTLKTPSVIDSTNAFIASLEQLCKDMEDAETPTTVNNNRQQLLSLPSIACKSMPVNISSPVTVEKGQSSSLRVTECETGTNEPVDAQNSFVPRKSADEQTNILQNVTNSSSEKQMRKAVSEIGIITDEAEINFAAFTLSALINASKQTQNKQNKEIRKELDNRCRGKSLGLLSNTQHLQLCKYFAELQQKDLKQLISIRDQLENHIQEATSSDPFSIENVPEAQLLQLAATNLLISSDPMEGSV